MGLNCQIAMKLARKMVVRNRYRARVPALYLFLLFRLMYPFRALMQDDRCMPQYMPDRIKLCKLKQWRRMMGNDHPNLLASLPRLMLLGRNQRTCSVPSLTGMTMFREVAFFPKSVKLLRAMFSVCIKSARSFALEFNSCDNRILVLNFRNGVSFMSTELYDRFNGIIRKTKELKVNLDHDRYLIDLNVQISEHKTGFAKFFYAHGISLPFPMDYDTGDFNIERYSLVSFWLSDEILDFDRRCDERLNQIRIRVNERLNQKRIRDCKPSKADSKRIKE